MHIGLDVEEIQTLARASEYAVKAIEVVLRDEEMMINFTDYDRKKMAAFCSKSSYLAMMLDGILAKVGQPRPPYECWETRVLGL